MSSLPTFVLPDLASYCDFKFKQNPHYQDVSPQSEAWMETFSTMKNDRSRQAYYAARFSLLTAYCFPDANAERYRLCCDYIAALFAFDDVADEGDLQDNVQGMKAAIDITIKGLRDPHGTPPTGFVPAEMMRS